ncbi:transposase [Salisaeta longa]|uniref:transposase n=1 Tax=Salisaeta longa TaxID=503170 RepID=UPI000422FB47|nr:transposase [Salisaeta longa]
MAYKYRVYPTKEQRRFLAQTFGCARYVWNWALEHRTNVYHDEGESLGFAAMCKRLTQLKKDDEHEWLKKPSSVVLQQSLRNQEQAFTNFFEGRAGYPSFKQKRGTQTARHTKAAFSYDADTRTLKLAKVPGTLKVNWGRGSSFRELRGEPTAVTISKDPAGRYFVSIEFKAPVQDKPKTGKAVGVDVGLESYITLSTGEKVGNPRFLEDAYRRLRKEQKALSRKEKGSNNWERQKRRVAKAYAKVADRRKDFLHKLSTRLVCAFDVITVETLSVKNMQKNRSLAKAISDAAWSEFIRQLEYKAKWYDKTLVKVDRWFPSTKRCSDCGHVGERKPLHVREWTCTECGCVHDRDVNAAKNLSRVGQARTEAIASKAPGDQRKTIGAFRLHGSGR